MSSDPPLSVLDSEESDDAPFNEEGLIVPPFPAIVPAASGYLDDRFPWVAMSAEERLRYEDQSRFLGHTVPQMPSMPMAQALPTRDPPMPQAASVTPECKSF